MGERVAGRLLSRIVVVLFGCAINATDAAAQSPGSGPLTLNEAIQLAVTNYSAI